MIRLPSLRFAQTRWRAVRRIYWRHIAHHRHTIVVGLLVLAGTWLLLATLSSRHSDRTQGPSAARPSAALGESVASPEKPTPPARPPQEAAMHSPPPVAPPAARPAWLRYAVPAPPTGNRPLVAIVFDDLGLD